MSLRSFGFALAALGLVLSATVHVASLFAVVPRAVIPPLFGGAFVLAVPLAVAARLQKPRPFFGPSLRQLMKDAPPWAERAFQIVFLYVVVQFGAHLYATRMLTGDRPVPPGGEVRMSSAFTMSIYLLCALSWWRRDASLGPGRSDRQV